jgi:hypothetical protein
VFHTVRKPITKKFFPTHLEKRSERTNEWLRHLMIVSRGSRVVLQSSGALMQDPHLHNKHLFITITMFFFFFFFLLTAISLLLEED